MNSRVSLSRILRSRANDDTEWSRVSWLGISESLGVLSDRIKPGFGEREIRWTKIEGVVLKALCVVESGLRFEHQKISISDALPIRSVALEKIEDHFAKGNSCAKSSRYPTYLRVASGSGRDIRAVWRYGKLKIRMWFIWTVLETVLRILREHQYNGHYDGRSRRSRFGGSQDRSRVCEGYRGVAGCLRRARGYCWLGSRWFLVGWLISGYLGLPRPVSRVIRVLILSTEGFPSPDEGGVRRVSHAVGPHVFGGVRRHFGWPGFQGGVNQDMRSHGSSGCHVKGTVECLDVIVPVRVLGFLGFVTCGLGAIVGPGSAGGLVPPKSYLGFLLGLSEDELPAAGHGYVLLTGFPEYLVDPSWSLVRVPSRWVLGRWSQTVGLSGRPVGRTLGHRWLRLFRWFGVFGSTTVTSGESCLVPLRAYTSVLRDPLMSAGSYGDMLIYRCSTHT
nr:hypothetical protein Iba_chr04bCG1840 [Ipomoea batatas]